MNITDKQRIISQIANAFLNFDQSIFGFNLFPLVSRWKIKFEPKAIQCSELCEILQLATDCAEQVSELIDNDIHAEKIKSLHTSIEQFRGEWTQTFADREKQVSLESLSRQVAEQSARLQTIHTSVQKNQRNGVSTHSQVAALAESIRQLAPRASGHGRGEGDNYSVVDGIRFPVIGGRSIR